jgi:hypothetical protein
VRGGKTSKRILLGQRPENKNPLLLFLRKESFFIERKKKRTFY